MHTILRSRLLLRRLAGSATLLCGLLMLMPAFQAKAQCTNSTQNGVFAAPAAGATYTISTTQNHHHYNQMTGVVAGSAFTSSTSASPASYITVRSGTYNGPVVASGFSPLTWGAASAGTYFIHYNSDQFCGTGSGFSFFTSTIYRCTAPQPGAVSATPAAVCLGSSTNLNATAVGSTIKWYTAATGGTQLGTSASGVNFSYTPASAGSFTYYAEAVGSGCTNPLRTPVTVTVNALPPSPGAISASPSAICLGTATNLNATSGANFIKWYPVATGGTSLGTSVSGANFSVTPAAAGSLTYYAEAVSPANCANPTRTPVTVTVIMPATPSAVSATPTTICQGAATNLNATSAGNMIQWFTTATGGTSLGSSASGANFSVTPAATGSVTYYAEAVSGSCTNPTRTPVTLSVAAAPAITTQPAAQTVCAGQPLSLSVTATNATSYQWKLNGTSISGATSATYTVASAAAANAGSYTVVVSGATVCGSLTSDPVSVTVNPSPSVAVSGPGSICVGDPSAVVILTGSGQSAPYTFTYNINGGASQTVSTSPVRYIRIQQNLADCFHLAEVQAIQLGTGTNVAAGKPVSSSGSATGYPTANLTDGILNNYWHSLGCGAGTWIEIDLGAEYDLSEVRTVNRQDCCWAREANLQLILKDGSGTAFYSQQVNAYQGQNTNYLCSFPVSSAITLPVSTASAQTLVYQVTATSSANSCTSTVPASTTVTVNPPPAITTQPLAQNICIGQPMAFSVVAGNATGYQWQLNGANIPGATAANYSVAGAATANTGSYAVVVSGSGACSAVTSNTVAGVADPGPTSTISAPATVCQNDPSAYVTITGSGSTPPYTFTYNINGGASQTASTNQPVRYIRIQQNLAACFDLAEVQAIQAGTGTNVALGKPVSTSGAVSTNPASFLTDGSPTTLFLSSSCNAGTWIEIDLGAEYALSEIKTVNRYDCCQYWAANLQLILKNSSGAAFTSQQINAYQGQNTGYTCTFPTSLLSNLMLPVNTASAQTFQYQLVSASSAFGCTVPATGSASVSVPAAQVITTQPTAQTLCAGQPLSLSVAATNAAGYQWKYNGNDIAGATASAYTIPNAAIANSGTYSVVVSGASVCGTTGSSAVPVTVNFAPPAPTVTSYSVCQNAAVPVGSGLTATLPATGSGSMTLSFNVAGQPGPGPTSAPGTSLGNAVIMPPLPPGTTITSVNIIYNGVDPLDGFVAYTISHQDQVRIGLAGAITLAGIQSPGSDNTPYPFNYNATSTPSAYDPAIATVNLTYWAPLYSAYLAPPVNIFPLGSGVASAVINYTYPLQSTIQWYTAATGGTSISTASPLNPGATAGSGVSGTGTAGVYTYYAESIHANGCPSATRSAATFAIDGVSPNPLSAPANACVGEPAAVLFSNTGGASGTTFTYNINGGASQTIATTPMVRYVRIRQNLADCFHLSEVRAIQAGTGVNVAAGKPVTSSGASAGHGASLLTDGNVNNYFHSVTCDTGTWVEIDLGAEYNISQIKTVNRQDCCWNRAANLQLILKNGSGAELSSQQIDAYQGQNTNYLCTFPALGGTQASLAVNTSAAGTFQYNITSATTGNGCTLPVSASATVVVSPVVAITTQPAAQTVCAGQPLTLGVVASNAGSYQWKLNGAAIPGATAATYTVASAAAVHAGSYSVVVTGLGACTTTSNAVNVAVIPAVAITTQPAASQTICEGQPFSLSVVAGNATGYQWKLNGNNIPGATSATYTVAAVAVVHAGSYTVDVSGNAPCGSVTSGAAILTVQPAVTITTQPAAQAICAGQPLTLSVVAGNASSYQWKLNGNNIPGATSATYAIASAQVIQAGAYRVAVSGPCGAAVTSSDAVVSVSPYPTVAPATTGYTVCQNATVPAGGGLTATPSSTPFTGSLTLSFSVTGQPGTEPNTAPGITLGNTTTMPALPAGATITSVTITYNGVDPKSISYQSDVRIGLAGAITLAGIQSPGTNGSSNAFNYSANSVPAAFNAGGGGVNLTYWESYNTDYSSSADATFPLGTNVATAVINYSYPVPQTVQWFTTATGGTAFATGTPMDPTTAPGSGLSGTATVGAYTFYAGSMSLGGCAGTARTAATLTIKPLPTATVSAPANMCAGGPAALVTLNAAGGIAPYTYTYNINGGTAQTANTALPVRYIHIQQNLTDWFNLAEVQATQLGTGTNVAAGKPVTSSGTQSGNPASNLTDGNLTNLYHSSTMAAGNWVEIDLGQEYALSEIKIVNRLDCCQDRAANLQLILKNGAGVQQSSQQINAYQGQNTNYMSTHAVPGNTSATIPVNTASAGTQQFNLVSVSSASGCATASTASATVTVNPYAAITTEPQASVALCAGNPLILSVAASDAVSYQWRKGNASIAGATGSSYAVPGSAAANAGSYRAIAIGGGGCNDTSAISTVSVSAMATTLASGGTAVNTLQPDGYSLVYTDASCQPIAAITDAAGGNLLGMTNASVFLDTSVQTFNGAPYLQRHYGLNPVSSGPATVKLYATQAEFDAFNNWVMANGNTLPRLPTDSSDATGISHVSIRQFHGLPSSGTTGPGGQYDAAQSEVIANTAINTSWNGSYWTMSFPVSGFSGFFIGSALSAALPVELVSFDAQATGTANLVSWKSAYEDLLEAYEVERSADGRTFTPLMTVAAAGKAHDYHYSDDQPLSPVSYYRLRMVDADGAYRYSKTVSVLRGISNGSVAMNVYPNPAKDQLTIRVEGAAADGQVALCDLSGRVVLRGALSSGTAELDVRPLAGGVYLVVYEGNGVKEVTKVTVTR